MSTTSDAVTVEVPDIGDFQDVPIIEILVSPGDTVAVDDPLLTLESDKATMDVPSPAAGTVRELRVKLGDRVSEGSVILMLEPAEAAPAPPAAPAGPAPAVNREPAGTPPRAKPPEPPPPERTPPHDHGPVDTATKLARPAPGDAVPGQREVPHASPAVRRFARELGVELRRVPGSGPRGRVVRADVEGFVKQVLGGEVPPGGAPLAPAGLPLLPWPQVDFARFGPVETRPLPRLRKLAGANLARNWVMIPHVTHHDEADVTELERFRVGLNEERAADGAKVTLLAFLVKACAVALARFPELNASLDGESLVLKRYFHIGFAADTPNGLLVPVVKDADRKGVLEIAGELRALAARAREGKLAPADMQGGTFSISSLGGVGGTGFTPIINAPEVGILGVSRAARKPVWDGSQFVPRLMLPLSLSYDHRVVDGAGAGRFTAHLAGLLADLRRLLL